MNDIPDIPDNLPPEEKSVWAVSNWPLRAVRSTEIYFCLLSAALLMTHQESRIPHLNSGRSPVTNGVPQFFAAGDHLIAADKAGKERR